MIARGIGDAGAQTMSIAPAWSPRRGGAFSRATAGFLSAHAAPLTSSFTALTVAAARSGRACTTVAWHGDPVVALSSSWATSAISSGFLASDVVLEEGRLRLRRAVVLAPGSLLASVLFQ